MALIRSLESIVAKWKRVTPTRGEDYKIGVTSPLKDWEKETLAASDRRDEGMRKAIADGRIDRGIKAKSFLGWQKPAVTKGPNRWIEGIGLAGDDYKDGFGKFHAVIEGTDPGPRFAKGDPRNWERSKKIGIALHLAKIKG